jgi:enoyl-[acyl-carrier protein] reductase II
MTKEYLAKEAAGASLEELEHLTLGGLKKVVVDGDVQNGSLMAGQIAGLVKDECTCKELIERVCSQAEQLLGGK